MAWNYREGFDGALHNAIQNLAISCLSSKSMNIYSLSLLGSHPKLTKWTPCMTYIRKRLLIKFSISYNRYLFLKQYYCPLKVQSSNIIQPIVDICIMTILYKKSFCAQSLASRLTILFFKCLASIVLSYECKEIPPSSRIKISFQKSQ